MFLNTLFLKMRPRAVQSKSEFTKTRTPPLQSNLAEHPRASQTGHCPKTSLHYTHKVRQRSDQIRIILDTTQQAKVPLVSGIKQINHSYNQERPCTTTQKIKKWLSTCQALLCLDLVSFPVLSQIKTQAPLHVVPFRQFLTSQPCDHTLHRTRKL